MGYLICDKCRGYYELRPGERPEEFDECECGGELEYHEYSTKKPSMQYNNNGNRQNQNPYFKYNQRITFVLILISAITLFVLKYGIIFGVSSPYWYLVIPIYALILSFLRKK